MCRVWYERYTDLIQWKLELAVNPGARRTTAIYEPILRPAD